MCVPLLRERIEALGPDQMTVGTNLAVDNLFVDSRETLHAIEASVAGLPESERKPVCIAAAERGCRI
jgi:predicted TIM-barrel fold metal-dependent hydrolase